MEMMPKLGAQTFTRAPFRSKHLRARRFDPNIYASVVSTRTFTRSSFRPEHLRARRAHFRRHIGHPPDAVIFTQN